MCSRTVTNLMKRLGSGNYVHHGHGVPQRVYGGSRRRDADAGWKTQRRRGEAPRRQKFATAAGPRRSSGIAAHGSDTDAPNPGIWKRPPTGNFSGGSFQRSGVLPRILGSTRAEETVDYLMRKFRENRRKFSRRQGGRLLDATRHCSKHIERGSFGNVWNM